MGAILKEELKNGRIIPHKIKILKSFFSRTFRDFCPTEGQYLLSRLGGNRDLQAVTGGEKQINAESCNGVAHIRGIYMKS